MLPQDNPFVGRDYIREGEVDPYDEVHGADDGGGDPFTDEHRVSGQDQSPFTAHAYPVAGDGETNMNMQNDSVTFGDATLTPEAPAEINNTAPAAYMFQTDFEGTTVNDGAGDTEMYAPSSSKTTGKIGEAGVKTEETDEDVPGYNTSPDPRRGSTWKPPASWTQNVPDYLIGPTEGTQEDLKRQSGFMGLNVGHLRANPAPNGIATQQDAGSDDEDPGCLGSVVQKARDVGKKGKAAGVRKYTKARTKFDSVPAYFKDHFGKKGDRGGPGGNSGGGIST